MPVDFDDKPVGPSGAGDLLQHRILAELRRPGYRPMKLRALARDLELPEERYADFRQAARELLAAGRIVLGSGRCLMLPTDRPDEIIGRLTRHPRGFGFVTPDPQENPALGDARLSDVHVPAEELGEAVDGDTVVVRLRAGRPRDELARSSRKRDDADRLAGSVVRILSRPSRQLLGRLVEIRGRPFVRLAGGSVPTEHPVPAPDASSAGAHIGDQVVVELLRTRPAEPTRGSRTRSRSASSDELGSGPDLSLQAVVVEVLGQFEEPGVQATAIIRQYEIPDRFAPEVLEEARSVAERFSPEELLSESADPPREDHRDRLTITIDPVESRDFDDAVAVRILPDGEWELTVHVADVAHFVRPGSALDDEARRRGNSVYLPRKVVPMLPEVLSNGVCSLQEGVDRLCKTVIMRLDADGRPTRTRLADTVIRVAKRFSYEQVTEVLEGRTDLAAPAINAMIRNMDRLAKVLLDRRRQDGLLEIDLPKAELIYSAEGRVRDAQPENQDFSHRIIEMFMVETNEAVARFLRRRGRATLRRVHEQPRRDSLMDLRHFLKSLGLASRDLSNRHALQEILAETLGTPQQFAVHLAVLRSMRPATYSPTAEGHFALASRDYLHFTSPIRRYPDLLVHRAVSEELAARAAGRPAGGSAEPSPALLAELGRHCSRTERRAEEAEREYRTLKLLELLGDQVGREFAGTITSVTRFGLFVQLDQFRLDGLVPMHSLSDDVYELHERAGALVGQRRRGVLRIGDPVRVRVVAATADRRKLTLALTATGDGRRVRERSGAPTEPTRSRARSGGGRSDRGATGSRRSSSGRRGRPGKPRR